MQTINKDLLTVNRGIICHQVNCRGAMNSGIAKAIREKWPHVFTEYKKHCNIAGADIFLLLGDVQLVKIDDELSVANIFGQLTYGYDRARYTDYGALKMAFSNLKNRTEKIYFPYRFGSDRGGADWDIVSLMIAHYIPSATICRL